MLTMKCMKLTRRTLLFGFLVLNCFLLKANSDPVLEFNRLKEKYPDNPIVSSLAKREVTIIADKNGVPVMQVRDEQIEMVLTNNAADFSESKEYFTSKTEVKKLEAFSLVPGKNKYQKVPVPKFIKSTEFGNHLYYDDSYCYAFHFPVIGKGVKRCTYSEIEIKDPYYPLIFYFGSYIPRDCAELTVIVPENIKINFHLFGRDTASVVASKTRKGKMITYKWISHQLKDHNPDFMAPGVRYIRPHIIVHIASMTSNDSTINYMGSMDDLIRWEDKKINDVNKKLDPQIISLTDSIVSGIENTTDKIQAIYKWVQNNIKYIAIEDGDNGYVPREAAMVLKRRYGDCKDKSSLLTAMIRSIGEKAYLVSVGTRELPYKYSEFPSIACANHMVAAWWNNDQPYILDGTSRYNTVEDIPAAIEGKECLIAMGNGKYQLYTIPVANLDCNIRKDSIRLSIHNNLLSGVGKSVIHGEIRTSLAAHLDGMDKEKQLKLWAGGISGTNDKLFVKKLEVSDINKEDKPLEVEFEFQMPDYVVQQGGKIYVNMNIDRDLSQLDVKTDRELPIEVEYKKEHHITYCLKVPETMGVSYLPDSVVFEDPRFGFSHSYKKVKNEIFLTSKIYINTLYIEGADLSRFREMLLALKKAYRQTIILTNNN